MLNPNQLNLIADKLRMLRGRIHAELGVTMRQSDTDHATELRQQLRDIAVDLEAIEQEHVYIREWLERPGPAESTAPGLCLDTGEFIPARELMLLGAGAFLKANVSRPATYSGWEPGTILKVAESNLAAVVHTPGDGVEVYIK